MWFVLGWLFIAVLCTIFLFLGRAWGRRDQDPLYDDDHWDDVILGEISEEHEFSFHGPEAWPEEEGDGIYWRAK